MDFAAEALKMAGALVVVLILMGGALLVLKKVIGEQPAFGGGMRLLGGLRLGPGKSIILVEVADEVLVLGATARELTLLARVEDPERVKRLRSASSWSPPKFGSWARAWLAGGVVGRKAGLREPGETA